MAALVGNRPDDAKRFAEEAVSSARVDGDPFEVANILSGASIYVGLAGDEQRGLELADEALEIARRLANRYVLSMCLSSAANVRYLRDPARAVELFDESFEATIRNNTRDSQSRFFKAIAHVRLHEPAAAARELAIALPMMQQSGEPYYESMALAFAAVLLSRRDSGLAVRILGLIDRMREDGEFIGAERDLQMQADFRTRLEASLPSEQFDALWAEGQTSTLDEMIAVTLDALAGVAAAGD
jgi:hypothetical protein